MAGSRDETTFACKGEEARVEPHQVAFRFGYRSCEIIEPQFSSAAAQGFKGANMAAHERFEGLAECELQAHLAAVAFHQAKGIQLARRSVVEQSAEVPPICRSARPVPAPCARTLVGKRPTNPS
jgi:hypothetical protein